MTIDPEPQRTEKAQEGAEAGSRKSRETRTPAIAGLAIAVVLLIVGLWLAHELTAASKMQDCLMSGRSNCNVIEPQ